MFVEELPPTADMLADTAVSVEPKTDRVVRDSEKPRLKPRLHPASASETNIYVNAFAAFFGSRPK